MKKRLAVLALLVLLAASTSPASFGHLRIEKQACRAQPFCKTQLFLRDNKTERVFQFNGGIEAPATLDTWTTTIPGLSNQLLVAVASEAGGSDVRFDASVIAVKNGRPIEISPRLNGTSQDALCLGSYGGVPAILVVNFVWGDESHYAPHAYTSSLFRWNGAAFTLQNRNTTKTKHSTWRSAIRELGLRCEANYFAKVLEGKDL